MDLSSEVTTPPKANATLKGAVDCASARCGMDAGCRKEPDGSWICICTHDLLPQRPDGSCPRFVVTGPHHPPPNKKTFITIRRTADKSQQQPPAINPSVAPLSPTPSQVLPAVSSGQDLLSHPSSISTVLVWMIPFLGVLMAVTAFIWLKRRWRLRKTRNRTTGRGSGTENLDDDSNVDIETGSGHKSGIQQIQLPVCLTKNLLNQERFMANPQYDWNGSDCLGIGERTDELPNDTTQLLVPSDLMANVDQLKSFHLIRPEWIKLEQEIGEGCFGKVFRGSLFQPAGSLQDGQGSSANSEAVAVKVLKAAAGPTAQEDLLQEAEIMAAFSHPNILALKGIVLNGSSGMGPWLVFEYMALGDLAQLLRSANGNHLFSTKTSKSTTSSSPLSSFTLDQEDLHSIAEQIADGMAYLSSQHFVHRDLACRNCLVGQRPIGKDGTGGGLAVKISDFGMSRDVYTCDYYKIGGSRMLPVRWMSPESILYGKFTLESDVWSFGVVLWEVFALGVQPYFGHSNEQVVKLILQGILLTPPDLASPLICQLLNGCWKTQPSDRLTFAEIHSRLVKRHVQPVPRKQRTRDSSGFESSSGSSSPQTVTYVHLRHQQQQLDDYLQPLPDLPLHTYSNT